MVTTVLAVVAVVATTVVLAFADSQNCLSFSIKILSLFNVFAIACTPFRIPIAD
nr:MAG TPA: hypothetical protein [Caudoviricetes sp.]